MNKRLASYFLYCELSIWSEQESRGGYRAWWWTIERGVGFMSTLCDSLKHKSDTYLLCVSGRFDAWGKIPGSGPNPVYPESVCIRYCSPSRLQVAVSSDAIKIKTQRGDTQWHPMSKRSRQDPDSGNRKKQTERWWNKGERRNATVLACTALVRKVLEQ